MPPRSDPRPHPASGFATLAAVVAVLVAIPLVVVGLGFWTAPARDPLTATPPSAAPQRIAAPTSSAPADREPSNRALWFGDSLFIGGGYTDKRHSMAFLASRRLGYVSRITGGGGTGFVTANPEYDLPDFLGQIHAGALRMRNPAWVVIEGGSNDRGHPARKIRKNARKVLRIALRKHPDAEMALVGPIDTDGQYDDTRPVVRAMRRAAKAEGVPYINGLRWYVGNYDMVGPDYDHPTPEGHRMLARKLAKALRALGAGT